MQPHLICGKRYRFADYSGLSCTGGMHNVIIVFFVTLVPVLPLKAQPVEHKIVEIGEGTIRAEEKLRLGTDVPLFAGIMGLGVQEDGVIHVVDAKAHKVYTFKSSGSYAGQLGEEGEGPGQYTWPYAISAIGDSVIVFDGRFDGAIVFSANGLERRRTNWTSDAEAVRLKYVDAVNDAYVVLEEPYPVLGQERLRRALLVSSLGNELHRVFWNAPAPDRLLLEHDGDIGWYPAPFAPNAFCSAGTARIVCGWAGSRDLHVFDAKGRALSVLELDLPFQSITTADEVEALDAVPPRFKRLVKFGEHKPLYQDLVVDSEDRVWIQIEQHDSYSSYVMLDTVTRDTWRFEFPEQCMVMAGRRDDVVASCTTAAGEPIVIDFSLASTSILD